MKRTITALICLAMAAACSSKKADDASASPAEGTPAAAPAAAAEPATVEFTDALVLKYMDYNTQKLAIVARFAEETRKNMTAAQGDAAKVLQQIPVSEKYAQEMEAALKAKRAELGLGEEQFRAVEQAVDTMANARLLYNQMGGDEQLRRMEAEHKKQMEALSEAQRAEAEKAFGDVSKSLRDLKDGVDLRQKYGDQAADVLLKHADELAKQRMEAIQLLGARK